MGPPDRDLNLEKTRRIGDTVDRVVAAASMAGSSHQGDFLHIDPTLTYSTSNRPFEDLPENFLENISPHHQQHQLGGIVTTGHMTVSLDGPQLAALAPMSFSTAGCGESSGAYATLVPMAAAPAYASISTLKMEPQHLHSDSMTMSHSQMEKNAFGSGPAGLLSPLHRLGGGGSGSVGDMMSGGTSQNGNPTVSGSAGHRYVKMEMMIGEEQDRRMQLAQAETPPAVSNVELASNIIASLIGEQEAGSHSPIQQQHHHHHEMSNMSHLIGRSTTISGNRGGNCSSAQTAAHHNRRRLPSQDESMASGSIMLATEPKREPTSVSTPRTVYSTKDTTDPLNAEIDEDIYIDTKDLCRRIGYELKMHSIPQAIFAERILCRSQGTLSDLLRNPKPWNKLKSGRETFRRMYNWVQQPLNQRLAILDMWKDGDTQTNSATNGHHHNAGGGGQGRPSPGDGGMNNGGQMEHHPMVEMMMTPPTPAQNARNGGGDRGDRSGAKRPRLVFTDIQKRTLQAIFKETQRPSREMQQTIAEHLRLDLSTVANFFMNARRRSRCGPLNSDEPAPYQQIRPITPPPASPPPRPNAGTRSRTKSNAAVASTPSTTTMPHIEDTVSAVVEEAGAYARKRPHYHQRPAEQRPPVDNQQLVDEAAIAAIYDDIQATTSKHHPVEMMDEEPKIKRSTSDEEEDDEEEELNVDGSPAMNFASSGSAGLQQPGESVFVVQVQAPVQTSTTNQQRSLPVMSMNKTITVKVKRETPSSTAVSAADEAEPGR